MIKENLEEDFQKSQEPQKSQEFEEFEEFQKKKSKVNDYEEEFAEEQRPTDYQIIENIKDQQIDRKMRVFAFFIVLFIIAIQVFFINYFFYKISIKEWVLTDHQLNLFVASTIIEIYVIFKMIITYLFSENKGFIVSVIEAFKIK